MTTGTTSGRRTPALAEIGARAAVALIGIAALVTLSLSFDARVALYAKMLPDAAVVWGRCLSAVGTSTYMFTVSGLLTLGALALRARTRSPRLEAALNLLAGRAAYIFATLSAAGLASQFIKHIVGRARPSLFETFGPYHFDHLSMNNALASFPSGHATTAFAMALGLSLIVPWLRVALFTLACAIAASRIVVQAHYLSDIAAGGLLGLASALLVARAFARRGIAFTSDRHGLTLGGAGTIAGCWWP